MKSLNLLFVASVIVFVSCSETKEFEPVAESVFAADVTNIVAKFQDPMSDDAETRATFDRYSIKFLWAAGDTVGIFPNTGDQVSFPIKEEGDGKEYVNFNGGGWGLKTTSTYYAYYPFSRKNFWGYDAKDLMKVSFSNQRQNGKNSADFADTCPFVSYGTNLNGNINFTFNLLASYAIFTVTVPKATTYVKAILTTEDGADCFIQEGTYDLAGTTANAAPSITGKTYGSSITLDLDNVTCSSADESFTVFMNVPPTDVLSSSVRLELVDSQGNTYSAEPDRAIGQFKQGFYYARSFNYGSIVFADAKVKEICVANWDTNSDGELSYGEAASVTDIGTVFKENSEITTFNELQYFTGLTSIPDQAFYDCSNLSSVIIPTNVTSFGSLAVANTGLTSILLPNVTSLSDEAFGNCRNVVSIDIPNVTTVGNFAFAGCGALENLNAPKVISVGHDAFAWTSSLKTLSLPEATTFVFEGTNYAMFWNSSITQLELPKLTSDIVNFFGGYDLVKLSIPKVKRIISSGSGPFRWHDKLVDLDISSIEEIIGEEGFAGCTALESVNAPKLKSIGYCAFSGCTSLKSFIAPEVTVIEQGGLAGADFTSINMPNLSEIGMSAFGGCGNLEEFSSSLIKEIPHNAFSGCTNLKTIILPNFIRAGQGAFANIEHLETLYLGTGLNGLDDDLVDYNDLDGIYLQYASNNFESVFENTDLSNCTLYLPKRFKDRIINNLNKEAFKEVIYVE